MNPYIKYTLLIIIGVVIITGGLHFGLKANLLIGYIVAINAITFLTFWYDKSIAGGEGKMRVPEVVLHTLSFAGGPFASLFAQKTLRHKTQKLKFQLVPILALLHHLGAYYYHFYR